MSRRLLVTGASGFLGWHVCGLAAGDWEVFGTANTHPVDPHPARLLHVDLTDDSAVRELFASVRPDAVIHAAACSQTGVCERIPGASYRTNVEAAVRVAEMCAERRVACVFTSTDQVFDGRRGMYREEDAVGPLNVYGQHKAMAELRMREAWPEVVVCRLALVYGTPAPVSGGFLPSWIEALQSGRPLELFVDEYRSPVNVRDAARWLLLALDIEGRDSDARLLHLGGPERISRYEMGVVLADALAAERTLVVPTRQCDKALGAPRPADVSLDSGKANALGFATSPLREDLREVAALMSGR
jgi:dTDP-4-dehydrorhamnose reductase